MTIGQKAVFFDKDGTLLENVPYNVHPDRIKLMPGAREALSILHGKGFQIFVVSNQPGVAMGYFPEAALRDVEFYLRRLLESFDVPLAGFYYCPHRENAKIRRYAVSCLCGKPKPGMLLQAGQEHLIDLKHSWMVGDTLDDIEAGHRAGCQSILIENGNEIEWDLAKNRVPDYMALDLIHAAREIVSSDEGEIAA